MFIDCSVCLCESSLVLAAAAGAAAAAANVLNADVTWVQCVR